MKAYPDNPQLLPIEDSGSDKILIKDSLRCIAQCLFNM